MLRSVACIVLAAAALAVAAPAAAEPALWRLSDDDSTIYLFGTVHVLPPGASWRNDALMEAFAASETVWFETPANDPARVGEVVDLTRRFGLNPPGRLLSQQISREAREGLAALGAETGLYNAALDPFRPWFAAMTLTMASIEARGYDPQAGVEAVLWPLANEAGKRLSYLETIEEQFRFFADLPPAIEVGFLEQTIRELQAGADELDGLVEAWAAGDVAVIDERINGDMRAASPEVYDVLIVQRNTRWVQRIRELLRGSGDHFLALGAGHLAGSDGVVERLRAEGIEVVGP